MTLPASGNISLSQIQTEFSAPGGTSLTDFYRGGTYVPDHGNTSGIPVSGSISMSDFYGADVDAPIDADISNQTISAVTASPGTATASYRIDSDGNAYRVINGSSTPVTDEWLVEGSNSDFEVRATVQSGGLSSGTTGSWLATTSDRTWTVTTSSVPVSCQILVEIRTGASVLTSATIDLSAELIV